MDALVRAAALFDVDWLRGRNFQFYPLRYASAAAVTEDVQKVLGGENGPVAGQVELITIDRLNAIIVAAKSPDLLDQTVFDTRVHAAGEGGRAERHLREWSALPSSLHALIAGDDYRSVASANGYDL